MTREQRRVDRIKSEINHENIVLSHIIDGFIALKKHLPAFDNKIINCRILKSFVYENPYKLIFTMDNSKIEISDQNNRYYTDRSGNSYNLCKYTESVILMMYAHTNRLSSVSTIQNINARVKSLENNIELNRKDLSNFQEELVDWNNIKKDVEEYRGKYSQRLRGYIDMKR